MCGIVGVFPLNKVGLEMSEVERRQIALFLHNEVLLETVSRGKDATGISLCFHPNPNIENDIPFWFLIKQPVDTWDFFMNDGTQSRYKGQEEDANIERMMDVACLTERPMYHIIGHTRAGTVGSEYDPLNNHPIIVGNVVGVHNGGIKNYKKVYEKHDQMTPQGEVDSEVIFQLLAEVANDRELTEEDINYVTSKIDGPRAVIAYNRLYPEKVVYFHDKDRPLELAYVPEIGCAIIHSERKFLNKAFHAYQRTRLTARTDWPELSVDYRTVISGDGGVIDVAKEIDDEEMSVNQIFPTFTYEKTDYSYYNATEKTTKQKTIYSNDKRSVPAKVTSTSKAATPKVSVSSNGGKAAIALGPAQIEDHSDYGPEKVCTKEETSEKTSVSPEQIMDDTEDQITDVSGTVEPEDDTTEDTVACEYDETELRSMGANWAISEEAFNDDSLFVNRHKNKMSNWFSAQISEDDADQMVGQLYPEAFGEGFAVGFRQGAAEEAAVREDQDSDLSDKLLEAKDELNQLKKENRKLRETVESHKEKQEAASCFIANMKAFLLAAIISKGIGKVEGEGHMAKLVFSKDIENFISVAAGFKKVNPEMVRGIFTATDIKTIGNGLSTKAASLTTSKRKVN